MRDSGGLHETFVERWGRRALTLPLYFSLAVLGIASVVPLLLFALALDIGRQSSWSLSRALLFGLYYLLCECAGLLTAAGFWVLRPALSEERYESLHFLLQWRWAGALLAGLRFIYRLEVDIQGDASLEASGPLGLSALLGESWQ